MYMMERFGKTFSALMESLPYNFALQLNIDWFQPFMHTQTHPTFGRCDIHVRYEPTSI